MKRIDITNGAAENLFGVGKHGYRSGDPRTGQAATRLGPDVFNHYQEELANIVEKFGGTLDSAKYDQVYSILKSSFDAKFSNVAWGAINANADLAQGFYACTSGGQNTPTVAGLLVHMGILSAAWQIWVSDEALPRMWIRKKANQSAWNAWNVLWDNNKGQATVTNSHSGYQTLPNGLIIQWGLCPGLDGNGNPILVNADNNDQGHAVVFPTAFKSSCLSIVCGLYTQTGTTTTTTTNNGGRTCRDGQVWVGEYSTSGATFFFAEGNGGWNGYVNQQMRASWFAVGI